MKSQTKHKKLKKEVNRLRQEQNKNLLTQDELDRLTKSELLEEIKMLGIAPKVEELWEKTQKLCAKHGIRL